MITCFYFNLFFISLFYLLSALDFGPILEHPLTSTKRTRILERVPFESEKPFFKVLVQPSYFCCKANQLISSSVYDLLFTPNCKYSSLVESKYVIYLLVFFEQFVPLDFATRYMKKQGAVILSVPNGRSWLAEFRMISPKFMNCSARLCKGWHEFANGNNLEVGDICIFELLDGTEISFRVSIVHLAEYECHQWSQG